MKDHEPATGDLRSAAVQGLRWSAIVRPAVELVLLVSLVVLARLIPPAEFGHYAVAIIAVELAGFILHEGMGAALVQRADITREHLQAGFAVALLTALALTGLTLVAAAVVVGPIFGGYTADLVRLASPAFLLAALSAVPSAILRRRLAFARLSIIEITIGLVRAGACVALALAGLDAQALVLGGLFAWAVTSCLLWISAPPPPPRLRRDPARDLFGYALPASVAAVSWVGFRNCDYAIVGARLGAEQAGFYFRAYQLAVEYQKKISQVMSTVGFPVLARAESRGETSSMHGKMAQLLTVLLFPLLALLAVLAPVLVPTLFGPQWEPAVLPTQILALGGAATLVIDTAGTALMAKGRARSVLGYGWAHFGVYAGTVLLLAPLGLPAVAVAAAVVHTAFLPVAYILLYRDAGDRPLVRLWHDVAPATVGCLGLLAAAIAAAAALSAAGVPALVELAVVPLVAIPAYAATLRVCFPATWAWLRAVCDHVRPDRRVRDVVRRLVPAPRSA
jgi:O-antigen/teichoic acid export membrane protein